MAKVGDAATFNSKSPQKRKLASSRTQFNAWSSSAFDSPQPSRSPQRKRSTYVERVSPTKANALPASDVELEDGMTLINALGNISIRRTPTKPKPCANHGGNTGSPIPSSSQSSEIRCRIPTPQKTVPVHDRNIQPAMHPTSRRIASVTVGMDNGRALTPSSPYAVIKPCEAFLPSCSDASSNRKPSLGADPVAAPASEPVPKVASKIRVIGRRVESDSDSDSEDNNAGSISFPPRFAGAQRSGVEATLGVDADDMSTAGVTELYSDDETFPVIIHDQSRNACSPTRNYDGSTRSPHNLAEERNQPVRQIEDSDASLNSADGVLHFSRVPASPSKRPAHSSTSSASSLPDLFQTKTLRNAPSSEQGIFVHSDSDSDEDEVTKIHDDKPSSRRRRNKRLSVWSTKDETEVFAISSSETEEDVDEQVPPSTRLPSKLAPPHSTKKPNLALFPGTRQPPSRVSDKSSGTRNTRLPSKKRIRELLARYAEELYTALNEAVFLAKLPPVKTSQGSEPNPCEIIWSNTLKKTAGRAVVKSTTSKTTGGVPKFTVFIELAVKVVDSEERIRHTLSHEMCHLAVWVIDQVKENDHGPSFKAWAAKIMRARKDITITTRHSYEIAYKYEWRCVDCSQTYGRHSKSIRPSEQVCGRCKGRLKPLFEEKETRTSAWTLFVKGQMGPILASNPGMTRGEAMKEVGKLWRSRGNPTVADIDGVAEQLESLSMGA